MLGLPYVFKSAGWIGGFFVTLGLCLVTWRTSYYIGRELNGDPRPLHLFENAPLKSPSNVHDDPPIITRMRKPINGFPGIAREALGDAGSAGEQPQPICVCSLSSTSTLHLRLGDLSPSAKIFLLLDVLCLNTLWGFLDYSMGLSCGVSCGASPDGIFIIAT